MVPENPLISLPMLTAKSTDGFSLSGKLDNPAWKEAPVVHLERGWDGRMHPDLRTEVRFLWEPGYVYAGFRCPYRELNVDTKASLERYRWELWDLDIVELHLSEETDEISHYMELQAAPTGHWMDLEVVFFRNKPFFDWQCRSGYQVKSEIRKDVKVWIAEMKIPTRSVAKTLLEAGAIWSFNAYRTDGKGEQRRYLALSPTYTEKPNFHIPARFSRIRFIK
jgi:alpha-galactosidase